ncbi:hypothetical protein QMK19_37505 [Streptomyces sp. H10-C2]|uniref:lantibiotic dehydratase C-terminal domain-containing protein n=1 Tax=unclassified Streptomyces TaxID=2593676 RepID=UPI0024B9D6A2|nr:MULTISPECIES: lantibiotic dehydratase C-terminal domain-containing protein [unclassified Streptomyces]MDJ0346729.1 hypothetical protein [Streptomyces sp. PH10-H1]MDJ0375153.1 hypothetical protein [Streptomyces sp. H10-C2]
MPAPQRTDGRGGVTPGVPSTLPELVRGFRRADADSRWFFHRIDQPAAPGLALWFGGGTRVLREIEERIQGECAAPGRPIEFEHFPQMVTQHPHACDIEFTDDLATASSDLALELMQGSGYTPDEQLALAILHLRHLVALVPERERRAFLFQCWQNWTEGLTPDQRTELSGQAELEESAALLAVLAPPMRNAVADRWYRYLVTLHRVTTGQWANEGAPVNYHLFDHAHLTHGRLGIPAVTEALAARLVRASLSPSGRDHLPLAVPAAALQTA